MKAIKNIISLILEQEFFTKEKQPIDFEIHEQSPDRGDRTNRGWVVHKIEARIDGKTAGYIKISYIPDKNFREEFPGIVQYVDKIIGAPFWPGKKYKHISSDPLQRSNDFNDYPLIAQVYGLLGQSSSFIDLLYEELENLSEQELLELKKKYLNLLWKEYGEKFKEFEDYHVNKPLVDYIRVYPEFQRQRIGVALYEKAAKWLAGKGMRLYASGIQSTEAQKAWEWLKRNKGANIGTEKHGNKIRMYISYV